MFPAVWISPEEDFCCRYNVRSNCSISVRSGVNWVGTGKIWSFSAIRCPEFRAWLPGYMWMNAERVRCDELCLNFRSFFVLFVRGTDLGWYLLIFWIALLKVAYLYGILFPFPHFPGIALITGDDLLCCSRQNSGLLMVFLFLGIPFVSFGIQSWLDSGVGGASSTVLHWLLRIEIRID